MRVPHVAPKPQVTSSFSRLVSLLEQRSLGTKMFITMAITSTTASVRHDTQSECVIDELETITLYACQPE